MLAGGAKQEHLFPLPPALFVIWTSCSAACCTPLKGLSASCRVAKHLVRTSAIERGQTVQCVRTFARLLQ